MWRFSRERSVGQKLVSISVTGRKALMTYRILEICPLPAVNPLAASEDGIGLVLSNMMASTNISPGKDKTFQYH